MTEREVVFVVVLLFLSLWATISRSRKDGSLTGGLWMMGLIIVSLLMDVVDRLQAILEAL